jgi:hypothetical protein
MGKSGQIPAIFFSLRLVKAVGKKWNVRSHKSSICIGLKGQCHEMVVEVRPWSGRLGLN